MSLKTLFSKILGRLSRGKRNSNVEILTPQRAMGWAVDPRSPAKPATVTLFVDGHALLNIAANQSRADVLEAGMGPLHCGFNVPLPKELRDGRAHLVELCFDKGGARLRGGVLKIAGSGTAPVPAVLAADVSDPETGSETAVSTDPAPLQPGGQSDGQLPGQQGVAYLDRRRAAIAGWAMGSTAVTLRLDGQPEITLPLDRSVPGLGEGLQYGFFYPLPAEWLDAEPHLAEVCFAPEPVQGANPATSTPLKLDGSPVRFRLSRAQPLIEIVALIGQVLRLRLRDTEGAVVAAAVGSARIRLVADGAAVDLQPEAADISPGLLRAILPAGCREICLYDSTQDGGTQDSGGQDGGGQDSGGQDGLLGRYFLSQGAVLPQEALLPAVPEKALSETNLATATAAFAAFCAAPDARFDPLWYGQTYGITAADALQHYREQGAAQGHAPGPFFDETRARASQPDLTRAIAQGALPCAFALDLVPGVGLLSLPMPSPEIARAVAAVPLAASCQTGVALVQEALAQDAALRAAANKMAVKAAVKAGDMAFAKPAPLPAPSTQRPPASCIYAAWLARLDLTPEQQADIARDESRMRQKILAAPLTEQPLVSIIMPSFNRAYTIGEAIQSVLEQSYQNWELLVCDDASEDKTAEVLRGFDDPRIRYMQFTKSNGAATRNKGLRFARGSHIAYLDSDNIWHPQFLDLMLRALLAVPGTQLAYGAYLDTEIRGASVVLDRIGRAPFRAIQLSSRNFMDLNTILHHRRLYDWMGGFDESLPRLQDWDLMLRYTSIFQPLYVNHIGVFYRRNVAWGQVTHLFTGSGAQNSVNDKTNRRLTEAHERLAIGWPSRGRVTVLLDGPNPGDRLLAESLARLASAVADVDFLDLSGTAAPADPKGDPAGLLRHVMPSALVKDWYRLCHALPQLLRDQPVLTVAASEADLRGLPADAQQKVYRLIQTAQGLALRALSDPARLFHLGALPLAGLMLPQAAGPDAGSEIPPRLLLVPGGERSSTNTLISQAKARNLSLLLPPNAKATGDWQLISAAGVEVLGPDAWAGALAACNLAASLLPVSALSGFAFSLLTTLQGQGVPLAVLRDEKHADALVNQWLEARGAYDIKVATPQWLFDKLVKLHSDPQTCGLLADRGQRVHQIHLHPELVQERLAHALYRMLFDPSIRESLNDQP